MSIHKLSIHSETVTLLLELYFVLLMISYRVLDMAH